MRILNTSIQIKDMELKNRLVMPPMATAKASEGGKITPQTVEYYKEKSAGGYIGLIVTEHSYVSIEGKAHKGQVSISRDEDIEGLSEVTAAVHDNGTKIMAQISHAGGAAKQEVTGGEVLGVSASAMPKSGFIPTMMTLEDIHKVIEDFKNAVIRAKNAGFDAVEIHSAHGYLLNQFFSPLTNKRTDAYNGTSIEGRTRLHLEIIAAVREAVGNEYPIALRLGACDYTEGGITLEDSIEAVKLFENAGIDLIDISGGFCGYIKPGAAEQGYFSELSGPIKASVNIPVILTGGITDAEKAEELLEDNKADLIGVGRAILKDSEWAEKAMQQSNRIF